jgi:hypothetical protein
VSEALGIIAVGIPRGDVIDPLGEELTKGMVDLRRVPPVAHGGRQAFRQANLAVDPAQ